MTSSSPSPRWRGEGCLGSGSWAGEEGRGGGQDGCLAYQRLLRVSWLTPRSGRQSVHCHQGCIMEQGSCCAEDPRPGPIRVSASHHPVLSSGTKTQGMP